MSDMSDQDAIALIENFMLRNGALNDDYWRARLDTVAELARIGALVKVALSTRGATIGRTHATGLPSRGSEPDLFYVRTNCETVNGTLYCKTRKSSTDLLTALRTATNET